MAIVNLPTPPPDPKPKPTNLSESKVLKKHQPCEKKNSTIFFLEVLVIRPAISGRPGYVRGDLLTSHDYPKHSNLLLAPSLVLS